MSMFYPAAVLVYICVVTYGVANVVTSVFVESAVMTAQHYRDLIVDEKRHMKRIALRHIAELFEQLDPDGLGEIGATQIQYVLADPSLHCYVEALGISPEDMRTLFR